MSTSDKADFSDFDDNTIWERDRRSVSSSCNHSWEDIYFVDEVYTCGGCALTWTPDEATSVLLASSRDFSGRLINRLAELEDFVSTKYDLTNCVACNKWDVRSNFLDLGSWYTCYNHIPLAIGDGGDTDEVLRRAVNYINNSAMIKSRNLKNVALWEQLVAISSDLAEEMGDKDDELAAKSSVILPIKVQKALGLQKAPSIRDLANTTALLVESGLPSSRTSAAYLISLLSLAYDKRLIKSSNKLEASVESSLEELAFMYNDRYVEIAMELCGDGMRPGTVFDGDIASQALALLSRRSVYYLIDLFKKA